MNQRMDLQSTAPDALKAALTLEKYVRSSVDHKLLHLIKLRASVLNGCAFCVDMHSTEAVLAGESSRRLFAVAAWRESPFFTDVERAALALTDAVTQIDKQGVPDEIWESARAIWSEKELADLLLAIATINVWNRLSISVHAQPPADTAAYARTG
ncbi:MAG TPA: carboxymuconolactone decarboxylase family protein [Polyangiaceae bacterium]|nr:carboxymuconolactone decarboxylase family protein [Polyangiaceae bacterium]